MDSLRKSLKGCFPFRLGTVSYIIPDDILPNVRYLADAVDDIELVLFESDELSNIPDEAAIAELADIAGAVDEAAQCGEIELDARRQTGDSRVGVAQVPG